jgi:hypothetical protein
MPVPMTLAALYASWSFAPKAYAVVPMTISAMTRPIALSTMNRISSRWTDWFSRFRNVQNREPR